MQHGLRSDRFSLRPDERAFAAELRESLAARMLPVDAAERATVEVLLVVEIKLARLDELEMRALDMALDDEKEETPRRLPSLSTLDRYRGRLMRERREVEARLEQLRQTRTKFSREIIDPSALRYLAEIAERRAPGLPLVANDESCTKEPEQHDHSPGGNREVR